MNVNLKPNQIREFTHGKLIYKLYNFETRWFRPTDIKNVDIKFNRSEVARYKRAIKENQRVPAPFLLAGFGIVSGFHVVEAFRQLEFDKIPVLWGKLK